MASGTTQRSQGLMAALAGAHRAPGHYIGNNVFNVAPEKRETETEKAMAAVKLKTAQIQQETIKQSGALSLAKLNMAKEKHDFEMVNAREARKSTEDLANLYPSITSESNVAHREDRETDQDYNVRKFSTQTSEDAYTQGVKDLRKELNMGTLNSNQKNILDEFDSIKNSNLTEEERIVKRRNLGLKLSTLNEDTQKQEKLYNDSMDPIKKLEAQKASRMFHGWGEGAEAPGTKAIINYFSGLGDTKVDTAVKKIAEDKKSKEKQKLIKSLDPYKVMMEKVNAMRKVRKENSADGAKRKKFNKQKEDLYKKHSIDTKITVRTTEKDKLVPLETFTKNLNSAYDVKKLKIRNSKATTSAKIEAYKLIEISYQEEKKRYNESMTILSAFATGKLDHKRKLEVEQVKGDSKLAVAVLNNNANKKKNDAKTKLDLAKAREITEK